MALAECLLYEGRSLESARGPQSFRTIPSRQLLTGEPCAGEPHARFGGRGVRLNRTSLPLLCYRRYAAQMGATNRILKPLAKARGYVLSPLRGW